MMNLEQMLQQQQQLLQHLQQQRQLYLQPQDGVPFALFPPLADQPARVETMEVEGEKPPPVSPFARFGDLTDLVFAEGDPRLELKETNQADGLDVNDKKRHFEYKMVCFLL
jgi:hypothetical protein